MMTKRAGQLDGAALDQDLPAVRPDRAREGLDQGALARAVVSDQGHNFAGDRR